MFLNTVDKLLCLKVSIVKKVVLFGLDLHQKQHRLCVMFAVNNTTDKTNGLETTPWIQQILNDSLLLCFCSFKRTISGKRLEYNQGTEIQLKSCKNCHFSLELKVVFIKLVYSLVSSCFYYINSYSCLFCSSFVTYFQGIII